jgi:PKD repeat protein
VSPSTTSINEGTTMTFNVSTTNVGTATLYWTIAGTATATDFASSTGTVNVVGDSGAFSVIPVNDALIEGPETFIVSLHTGSTAGPVVATSATVTVNDMTVGTTVASFTSTPNSGTLPIGVQFTDTSSNAPTSWSWDFGDGATSTAQNPLHTYASTASTSYNAPGSYLYVVPTGVTSITYSYLSQSSASGLGSNTVAVTPGQNILVGIGVAGAISNIGGLTVPAFNATVVQFSGDVDRLLYQDIMVATTSLTSYSGVAGSAALTAGAGAAGIYYAETVETSQGDKAASIVLTPVVKSALLTAPVASITAMTGRGSVSVFTQPTPGNNFIATVHIDDDAFVDPASYSYTMTLQHVMPIVIHPSSAQFTATLTATNSAGSNAIAHTIGPFTNP